MSMDISDTPPKSEAYIDAVMQQNLAADPTRDIFVSANAGSGKTHVLVNRVTRTLLLETEVRPEKILCLTYTKAAASEMQSRLFKTLGKWSIMPEDALREELDALLGADQSRAIELRHARSLFAQALETPEGLKVQTIHAFCERLLSRFPIEAGILPGFEALDDGESRALRDRVWTELLKEAAREPAGDLAGALSTLIRVTADRTMEELRRWMGYNVYKITAWEAAGGTAPLAEKLGVDADMTESSVKKDAWEAISKPRLKAAIAGLRDAKSKKQDEFADDLTAAMTLPDPVAAFDAYAAVILTGKGVPTTQIGTTKSGTAAHEYFGTPRSADTADMHALSAAIERLRSLKILAQTRAVYTLSRWYVTAYQNRKRALRRLDFADQVMLARRLLTQSHVSDWVQCKLDGGVDYILVDEAQDTSAAQWDIVDVLRDMFTHDQNPNRRFPRTLFAVGDEKQSIYSFQGADPELFIGRSRTPAREPSKPGVETVHAAKPQEYSDGIRMRMSFRSAPDILSFIDEIFLGQGGLRQMFDPENIPENFDRITHTANRTIPGLIELWPLSPAPPKNYDEEAWRPEPVDALSADSARESLAREIAATIRGWLDTGELINVKHGKQEIVRPMKPKDILILVRKRTGPFFNAVIRHLKWNDIAVAGADRLVLSTSAAVQDLMSLARFVCLPDDDLALAEVLRGPMFDISEEDLFKLSHYRTGRLWPALLGHKDRVYKQAASRLETFIQLSKTRAPYEFFEGVLSSAAADGTSQLKMFYNRLSMEAADPIDAFLARALAHQRRGAPSLQHFVQEFLYDDQELKRELDGTRDEVRVMTIYGAKGLEAPVVILPDTNPPPDNKGAVTSGMLELEDGTFARPGKTADMPAQLLRVRDRKTEKSYQEYMRLLYVALTRAEARLLICGYYSGKPSAADMGQSAKEGSWHDLAQAALIAMGARELHTCFSNEHFKGYAFGTRPAQASGDNKAVKSAKISVPDWAKQALPPRPASRQVLDMTPSTLLSGLDTDEPPAPSPLARSPDRFRRGTIIHKLLELLPDIAPPRREAAAAQFLSGYIGLSAAEKDDITQNVRAVLDAPEFAEIFAPGSHAEVSLAGHAPTLPVNMRLNAQIDRLSVTPTRVFIVDYKSNRPPPREAADVPQLYLGQMAAYRELARTAYPGREVICGLLWTDGPNMMILPDSQLDQALEAIQAVA